jgi:hypothetical protein
MGQLQANGSSSRHLPPRGLKHKAHSVAATPTATTSGTVTGTTIHTITHTGTRTVTRKISNLTNDSGRGSSVAELSASDAALHQSCGGAGTGRAKGSGVSGGSGGSLECGNHSSLSSSLSSSSHAVDSSVGASAAAAAVARRHTVTGATAHAHLLAPPCLAPPCLAPPCLAPPCLHTHSEEDGAHHPRTTPAPASATPVPAEHKLSSSTSQECVRGAEGVYSPYSSPSGSPRLRRQPTKETRRLSISGYGQMGYIQLNQYKLKDEIGKVSPCPTLLCSQSLPCSQSMPCSQSLR